MIKERQPSFAGGEFSSTMWGRTDFAKYMSGARRLYNFFVTPHGGAMNRSGSYFVGRTKLDGAVRIIPFNFSDEDALILAVGDHHFRLYQFDLVSGLSGLITNPDGSPFEFALPYGVADLPRLRWAQLGDVITLVHPNYAPQELARTSSDNLHWTLTPVSFDLKPFPNIGGVFLQAPMADSNAEPDHTTYPAKQWAYKVTAVCQAPDGHTWESAPFIVTEVRYPFWTARAYGATERVWYNGQNWEAQFTTSPGMVPGDGQQMLDPNGSGTYLTDWLPLGAVPMPAMFPRYGNKQQTLFAPTPVPAVDPGYRILSLRVYCERAKLSGFVGELTNGVLVDDGATPDFSTPVPTGTNPFKVFDYQGNLVRTENPVTVCYYEGRRVFGGTPQRPTRIWASAVDDFTNYDEVFPPKDSDSLALSCAAQRFEQVRAIVPRKQLLGLTACSEWIIAGAGLDTVLAPTSIAAHPVTEFGSSWLAPLSLANAVLFVQRKGSYPKALLWEQNTWTPTDLSILSRHLFQGRQVVDWAYAEDPWSVIWCVMDDGKLCALTYVREHELVAWSQHELPGGFVEAVCSIPEGLEDAVYLVVRRTINGQTRRYIERFTTRLVSDSVQGVFLDAALSFRGDQFPQEIGALSAGTGGPWVSGQDAYLRCAGGPQGGFAVAGVVAGDEIVIGASSATPGRVRVTAVTGLLEVRSTVLAPVPDDVWADFVAGGTLDWRLEREAFAGLDHLEGQTVVALADGNVVRGDAAGSPLVVAGGKVTIGVEGGAAVVHIGLPYRSEFESLDSPNERGRQKNMLRVGLEVENSRGAKVGEGLDKPLAEWRQRKVKDSFDPVPLFSGHVQIPVVSQWNTGGRCAVVQEDPLPMSIIAVTREVEFGGE